MKCDKADVWIEEDDGYTPITLWDVTVDEEGNVTGTQVYDDFPGCEEVVTFPVEIIDAFFGEDFAHDDHDGNL